MNWILFSNPYLENRFRATVQADWEHEMGGFLVAAFEPHTWPGKFRWRPFKTLLGDLRLGHTIFVEAVIMVPNESAKSKAEYRPWDFEKALALARKSAAIVQGFELDFHTHPTSTGVPSEADIAHAGHYCEWYRGCVHFAIVTAYPLRLHYHRIEYGAAALPDRNASHEVGRFLSWRSRALRWVLEGRR